MPCAGFSSKAKSPFSNIWIIPVGVVQALALDESKRDVMGQVDLRLAALPKKALDLIAAIGEGFGLCQDCVGVVGEIGSSVITACLSPSSALFAASKKWTASAFSDSKYSTSWAILATLSQAPASADSSTWSSNLSIRR